MDFAQLTEPELLKVHAGVIDELVRGVVRTKNNPIGDYTEWLVCNRLALELQPNSMASYDGIDLCGNRYQIKGRRTEKASTPAQLSVIRKLELKGFDFLVAVIYNSDHSVRFAAKIPHATVVEIATYRQHVNGHVALISENVFAYPGVEDITSLLRLQSD